MAPSNSNDNHIARILTVIDGITEEVVELIEIRFFELSSFAHQFDVPIETDPQMYDRYAVGPDDTEFLCRALGKHMAFDFSGHAYFIDAVQRDS